MVSMPKPPKAYTAFTETFPKLEQAWGLIAEAGQDGDIDEKTRRLVKLGIAIGNQREGAIHANVRKALAMGVSQSDIYQVVALAAGNIGLPSCVAVFSWVNDEINKQSKS